MTAVHTVLRPFIFVAPFLVAGCDPVATANSVGQYMPVIGERCESAQCITASGKASSEAIKAEKLHKQQAAMEAAKQGGSMPTTAHTPSAAPAPAPADTSPFETTEPF